METMESKTIVVKTFETGEHNGFALIEECLFAVESKEWEEIGKYLKPDSKSCTDDYPYYIIPLWELYRSARIVEADDRTIEFLVDYGNKKALRYLQKGVRVARNISRISSVFNELALFHKLQIESDFMVDSVTNEKSEGDGFEKFWLIDNWQLPKSEDDIARCEIENKPLIAKAMEDFSVLLQSILKSKYLCCVVGHEGLLFTIRFVKNVCPWNPQIIIQLWFNEEDKHLKTLLKGKGPLFVSTLKEEEQDVPMINIENSLFENPYPVKKQSLYWENPKRFGKVQCSLNYFMETFLPSLTKDNYKAKLEELFPLF